VDVFYPKRIMIILVSIFLFIVFNLAILLVWSRPSEETEQNIGEELSKTIMNKKDGSEMALIPSGEFSMGSSPAEIDALLKEHPITAKFFESEQPQHTVSLDAFYLDKYEVTNAQYQKFMQATGHPAPKYWNEVPALGARSDFPIGNVNPQHPVVGVSWQDANAYCEWAGKRLPTEAEWEKAARGGLVGKRYPWGDELSRAMANYGGFGGQDKWQWTAPIGSFPPNGYGLYDMAGNVFEWCADWYDAKYYHNSPKRNPQGPEKTSLRVARGGSWDNNFLNVYYLRCAHRFYARPSTKNLLIGFRCCVSIPGE